MLEVCPCYYIIRAFFCINIQDIHEIPMFSDTPFLLGFVTLSSTGQSSSRKNIDTPHDLSQNSMDRHFESLRENGTGALKS